VHAVQGVVDRHRRPKPEHVPVAQRLDLVGRERAEEVGGVAAAGWRGQEAATGPLGQGHARAELVSVLDDPVVTVSLGGAVGAYCPATHGSPSANRMSTPASSR